PSFTKTGPIFFFRHSSSVRTDTPRYSAAFFGLILSAYALMAWLPTDLTPPAPCRSSSSSAVHLSWVPEKKLRQASCTTWNDCIRSRPAQGKRAADQADQEETGVLVARHVPAAFSYLPVACCAPLW